MGKLYQNLKRSKKKKHGLCFGNKEGKENNGEK